MKENLLFKWCKNRILGLRIFGRESGQSIVEFALILPLLLIFLTLPIDYARLIYTQMVLNSAATEALAQVEPDNVAYTATLPDKIKDSVVKSYGDQIDVSAMHIEKLQVGNKDKKGYVYYVYNSDKGSDPSFAKWFEKRNSNFHCRTVSLKLSVEFKPITFLGQQFLGSSRRIDTREYSRDVYAEGYQP